MCATASKAREIGQAQDIRSNRRTFGHLARREGAGCVAFPTKVAWNSDSGDDARDLVIAEEAAVAGPGLILHVAGELDIGTVPELRARLTRAVTAGATGVVVDLSRVTFIDSVSLAALVAARAKLGPSGRLAIVAATPFVQLVLEASGLDRVLNVFEDSASAAEFAFGVDEISR